MKVINYLRSKLTMKFQHTLFIDVVEGGMVCLYKDCFGKLWMAQSSLGFRVEYGKNNN